VHERLRISVLSSTHGCANRVALGVAHGLANSCAFCYPNSVAHSNAERVADCSTHCSTVGSTHIRPDSSTICFTVGSTVGSTDCDTVFCAICRTICIPISDSHSIAIRSAVCYPDRSTIGRSHCKSVGRANRSTIGRAHGQPECYAICCPICGTDGSNFHTDCDADSRTKCRAHGRSKRCPECGTQRVSFRGSKRNTHLLAHRVAKRSTVGQPNCCTVGNTDRKPDIVTDGDTNCFTNSTHGLANCKSNQSSDRGAHEAPHAEVQSRRDIQRRARLRRTCGNARMRDFFGRCRLPRKLQHVPNGCSNRGPVCSAFCGTHINPDSCTHCKSKCLSHGCAVSVTNRSAVSQSQCVSVGHSDRDSNGFTNSDTDGVTIRLTHGGSHRSTFGSSICRAICFANCAAHSISHCDAVCHSFCCPIRGTNGISFGCTFRLANRCAHCFANSTTDSFTHGSTLGVANTCAFCFANIHAKRSTDSLTDSANVFSHCHSVFISSCSAQRDPYSRTQCCAVCVANWCTDSSTICFSNSGTFCVTICRAKRCALGDTHGYTHPCSIDVALGSTECCSHCHTFVSSNGCPIRRTQRVADSNTLCSAVCGSFRDTNRATNCCSQRLTLWSSNQCSNKRPNSSNRYAVCSAHGNSNRISFSSTIVFTDCSTNVSTNTRRVLFERRHYVHLPCVAVELHLGRLGPAWYRHERRHGKPRLRHLGRLQPVPTR
jgi:hypothetical protein